jgi:hypothetical protein
MRRFIFIERSQGRADREKALFEGLPGGRQLHGKGAPE